MFKNILISGLLCTLLSADSFDIFLQKAIQNSPYLKSSSLAIKQAKEKGSTLTRYANPSLELEYSNFSPDAGDSDNGYRVNYSQPIRLWNVADDNEELSNSLIGYAKAVYTQNKANFTKNISLRYVAFAQQKSILKLGDEELKIAKSIYEISTARYDSGTISRGLMLQSKIDYETIQIKNESLSLVSRRTYYNLLKFAGMKEEVNLDASYKFSINEEYDVLNNPDLKILKTNESTSLSQAKVNSNQVSWMSVFAEYESEPEQDITRVGVNFPLAFFNTKSQERKIATLQAKRSNLILENQTNALHVENNRLKFERKSLLKQELQNKEILDSELELLKMFQNGYKIANINLLQLQDIKNKLIQTKRNLILIKSALDINAITTNYNQGLYND